MDTEKLNRRDFTRLAAATTLGAAFGGVLPREASAAPGRASNKPHIVYLMSDDQAWHDMGYYNHPHLKTPNLDAMAANGIRFDRFYAACPKCSPTRASLLTGRHPKRYDFFNTPNFPRKEKTVAPAMSAAGYVTGHFGKWHLGKVDPDHPSNPEKRGFDYYRSFNNAYDLDPTFIGNDGAKYPHKGDGSIAAVSEALQFIEAGVKQNKPTFSIVWYGSPHGPWNPAPEDAAAVPKNAKMSRYLAEIIGIDRSIGLLRKRLRELGIEKNTLVVYNADNGFETPGAKLKGDKLTIWEGGVRVPGCAEWPGRIRPRTVCDMPVSTIDLAPTAAALAGVKDLKMTGPIDGIDLTPLFDGKMTQRPAPVPVAYFGTTGLIGQRYKIMTGDPWSKSKRGRKNNDANIPDWHFYDLERDPGETKNLAADAPPEFVKMKQQLERWIDLTGSG